MKEVEPDKDAPTMWCVFRRAGLRSGHATDVGQEPASADRIVRPGDLVLVEVPKNCAITPGEARRNIEILELAQMIGEHWHSQEGVNGALLDALARLTCGA